MIVDVDGSSVHAATGGANPTHGAPTVVLVHGAGNDSTVWQLQTRYLAMHGLRAFAVDLPGHGRSTGDPLTDVGDMADWVLRFLDAIDVVDAHLVGHSMGTYIALEAACRAPNRVLSVTLCGTAAAMPVHPDLVAAADHDLRRAAALMASWGHGADAQVGGHPIPGMWMLGGARALVERGDPIALASDFRACMAYQRALESAATLSCPATVVIGAVDKMTPARGGRAVAQAIDGCRVVELAGVGHSMMTEDPGSVRSAILETVHATTPA